MLGFLWWNAGLRRVGAGRAGVFSNLVPVFGALAAWLVLGESLTPLQAAGAALAVVVVAVCQRR